MHHFHNNSWFFCNFTQTKINSKKAQPSECPFFSSPTGPLKNSDTLHLVLNASGTTGLETPPLWEGVKKTYFWEIFPKYGWVRVQIPKLSVTFTNHYFSAQKFPNVGGWGSQNPKPNPNFGWNLLNAFNNSQIKPEFFGGLPWATFQRK